MAVLLDRCRNRLEGDPRVILTATPGSSKLRVVAQSRFGAATTSWPVSDNGRVFAACAPVKRTRRAWTSELTLVDVRAGLRVLRTRLSSNAHVGPDCVASDAGTATMMVIRNRKQPHKFTNVGVTIGGAGKPRFSLPGGTRDHGIRLSAVSADGSQVLTELTSADATLINTRTGHYSRPFHPARRDDILPGRGLIAEPFVYWNPFASVVAITHYSGAVGIFDPRTLKTKRLGVAGRKGAGIEACFLPSGRILFAGDRIRLLGPAKLSVTNEQRTTLTRLDASAIGTPMSVSCAAAGSAGVVLIAASSGRLYETAASAVDGSALTPSG